MPVLIHGGPTIPKKKTTKPTPADVKSIQNADAARARNAYDSTPDGLADLKYERDQRGGLGTNSWNQIQQSTPTSSGGGGSYGGGYGGGGRGGGGGSIYNAEQQAASQSQIDTLMKLMQSGQMNSPMRQFTPDTQSRSALSNAYSADQARSGQAFDQLDQYLGGLGNAYADAPQAQVAQIDPSSLQALLQSQGASGQGLGAEAQFLQQQNGASADAQNRYQQAMQNMQSSWNQSAQSESQQARTYAGEELSATNRGLEALLDRNDATSRQAIEEQNFQQQLADRQQKMELIAKISEIAAGSGLSTPDMDIEKLLSMMTGRAPAPAPAPAPASAVPASRSRFATAPTLTQGMY